MHHPGGYERSERWDRSRAPRSTQRPQPSLSKAAWQETHPAIAHASLMTQEIHSKTVTWRSVWPLTRWLCKGNIERVVLSQIPPAYRAEAKPGALTS